MAIAFMVYSAKITVRAVNDNQNKQCISPKLISQSNQGNKTNPETYYYTGEPVTFITIPFEVEPVTCEVSYSCSMSSDAIVDLCNY